MNDRRLSYSRPNKGTISLDDLVEENVDDVVKNDNINSRDDEEDELDAYMASIVDDTKQKAKKFKPDNPELASDDEVEVGAVPDKVENLEADLAAAIAGSNASANKTTKRLNQLTKAPVSYTPFTKDFYVEVPELTKLTEDEVKELRLSLENIKVVGKSCPKPVTCWEHCGLSRKIIKVLKKLKYVSPTPIQAQAIPAIMSGRDVIGIAKTGCGKTLSFLLPMFRHILNQDKSDEPIALIITPTRELATQICDDATKFTKILGLRAVAIYGGPNISEQIGKLKEGAEIIVCTPGRMIEILIVNGGRVTNLNRCTFLVLDEADRLFDMGFEKQIRSIVDLIRPDRQTVMFSATFPKIMEAHARRILTKPIEIQVGGRSIVCKDVVQNVEIVEEDDKFLTLLPILQRHVDSQTSAIVFVSKQEKADSLLEDLMQAYDVNCLVLHGGIDKDDRISTFASFKSGQKRVLVATSVAARGLDVKHCICVVNYDCPNHYEDYVHRCGRTGRAGNKGYAYTFITPDQGQYASDIIKALELSGNTVDPKLKSLWDNYKTESEKIGRKIWTSSGFSGKGFEFDEAEANLVNEKKKHQKKSLGLQNSDDEDDEGETAVDSDAEVDASTLESEIKALSGSKIDPVKPTQLKKSSDSSTSTNAPTNPPKPMSIARQIAEQRAQALRAKLAPSKPEIAELVQPIPIPQPPQTERLEMKFEINDYHQQVRRRLTSKEALAKISESCETGITVRGKFCPVGDRPMEPKLYLAIEGTSQASLEKAHRELLLLVKDEYTRINSLPASRGRYRLL